MVAGDAVALARSAHRADRAVAARVHRPAVRVGPRDARRARAPPAHLARRRDRSSSSTIADTRLPTQLGSLLRTDQRRYGDTHGLVLPGGQHDASHDRSPSIPARSIRSRTVTSTSSSARSRLFDQRDRHARDEPAQAAAVLGRRAHRSSSAMRCPHADDRLEFAEFDGLLVDFCREPRRDGDRARPARPRRLRVRVPVRAHEPPARARHRHRVLHDRRAQPLRQLVARQGSRQPRRRRHRSRARRRSSPRSRRSTQEVTMPIPIKLASRLDPIKPSITLAVTAKAAKLKADGIDVISFGAGEPDFDTPDHIKDAARAALDKPASASTPTSAASLPLRKAIAAELVARPQDRDRARSGPRLDRREALALQPVHGAARSGRRGPDPRAVLGQLPRHGDARRRPPGHPRDPAPRTTSRSPPSRSRAACTPRTRAIVLNNPSNPTGAVYTQRADRGARQGRRRQGPARRSPTTSTASSSTATREYVLDRRGRPGGRGAHDPRRRRVEDLRDDRLAHRLHRRPGCPLIKAMAKIQGQSTSNPTHIAQIATLAALTGPQDCVATMRKAFDERRARDGQAAARDPRRASAASPRARSTRSPTSRRTSARSRPRARSSTTTSSCATGSSRSARSRSSPARASARPASCGSRTRAR